MNTTSPSPQEDVLMEKLKHILLKEDRAELKKIKETLDDPVMLSQKVMPVLEKRLAFFKESFPHEYRGIVDEIIEKKIKESQNELLDAIYPVMGKMIKKYIAHQFQLLKDKIDQSIKKTFSTKNFWSRIKQRFSGIKDSEIILSDLDQPIIQEIYIIQKNSGLLISHASRYQTIDQDVVAGMLTAIKSFVEDAFQQESEDLEMIQYGTYKIFIQNLHSYYFAVVMTGSLSSEESDHLSSELLTFAEKELSQFQIAPNTPLSKEITQKLHQYFLEEKLTKQS